MAPLVVLLTFAPFVAGQACTSSASGQCHAQELQLLQVGQNMQKQSGLTSELADTAKFNYRPVVWKLIKALRKKDMAAAEQVMDQIYMNADPEMATADPARKKLLSEVMGQCAHGLFLGNTGKNGEAGESPDQYVKDNCLPLAKQLNQGESGESATTAQTSQAESTSEAAESTEAGESATTAQPSQAENASQSAELAESGASASNSLLKAAVLKALAALEQQDMATTEMEMDQFFMGAEQQMASADQAQQEALADMMGHCGHVLYLANTASPAEAIAYLKTECLPRVK